MGKLKYLNLGCGKRYHKDWVNIDMYSDTPDVMAYNLLKGIPFPNNHFEVVYHAQVLEHIPKDDAHGFIKECFRVLKPGGVIRIVVPNLEGIVNEYMKYLKMNLESPTPESEANYDWILMEMYDQTVRNYVGGQMGKYVNQPEIVNEDYVLHRTGHVGQLMRDHLKQNGQTVDTRSGLRKNLSKLKSSLKEKVKNSMTTPASRIGAFRLSGEVHQWMYDQYSLGKLLKNVGFADVKVQNSYDSYIPNWGDYELDVKNGVELDHTSLFMEAKKP